MTVTSHMWCQDLSILEIINCCRVKNLTVEAEHPVSLRLQLSVERVTFQLRKCLKPIDRSIRALTDLTKEALPSSFLFWSRHFMFSVWSLGTFHWDCPLGLGRFSCSGTDVTTTSLPPLFLVIWGLSQVRSTCFSKPLDARRSSDLLIPRISYFCNTASISSWFHMPTLPAPSRVAPL